MSDSHVLLQPRQVIARVNTSRSLFCAATHRGNHFLICAIDDSLVIFTLGFNKLRVALSQTLRHDVPIRSVAYSNHSELISVSFPDTVGIYKLLLDGAKDCQVLAQIALRNIVNFEGLSDIHSMSWISARDVVVANSRTYILEIPDSIDIVRLNESSVPSVPRECIVHKSLFGLCEHETISASPCGRFLATFNPQHSLVKVWYYQNGDYEFCYLPHPAPVTSIHWRPYEDAAVLATVCEDRHVRVWCESTSEVIVTFSNSAKIKEESPLGVCWASSIYDIDPPSRSKCNGNLRDAHHGRSQSSLHGFMGDPSKPEPTADLLITTNNTGSISAYSIRLSYNLPRCEPEVHCSFTTKSNPSYSSQSKPLNAACFLETSFRASQHVDIARGLLQVILGILWQDGSVSMEKIQCCDGQVLDTPQRSILVGHSHPINHLACHRRHPLIATADDGNVYLWKETLDEGLDGSIEFCMRLEVPLVCKIIWCESDPILFMETPTKLCYVDCSVALNLSDAPADVVIHQIDLEQHYRPMCIQLRRLQEFKPWSAYLIVYLLQNGDVKVALLVHPHAAGGSFTTIETVSLSTWPQNITMASAAPTTFDHECYFWMLTRDGSLSLARVFLSNETPFKLAYQEILYSIDVSKCNVLAMHAEKAFGRLLLVSRHSLADSSQMDVCIYSQNGTIEKVHVEHQLSLGSSLCISPPIPLWFYDDSGDSLFGLGLSDEIQIYSPQRLVDEHHLTMRWRHTATIPTPGHCFGWTYSGFFISAVNQKISVTSRWRGPQAKTTIFDHMKAGSMPLPEYHPRRLSELLLFGDYQHVDMHLRHLHDTLISQNTTISSIPPLPVDCYLCSQPDPDKKTTSDILQQLSELLSSRTLPGITHTEQLELLGIIGIFQEFASKHNVFDKAALTFLYGKLTADFSRFHHRSSVGRSGNTVALTSGDFIWAFHSMNQEDILKACLPEKLSWTTLKALGVPLWLRSSSELKALVERVAKDLFTSTRSANSSLLYYLILKKKPTAQALFKSTGDQKLADFLKNDFQEPRWKTAAAKNAFVLLSQHKYDMAASFFILAGQLAEAIKICCKQLNDSLLAVLIARIYEGDTGNSFPKLLEEKILPEASSSNDFWMESICHWWLHRYQQSLSVLLAKLDDKTPLYTPHISTFYDLLLSKPQLRLASNQNAYSIVDRIKLWSKSAVLRKTSGDPKLALEDLMRVILFVEQESHQKKDESEMSLIAGRLEELRLELLLVDILERCEKEDFDGSETPYMVHMLQKYNSLSSSIVHKITSFLYKKSAMSSIITIIPIEESQGVIQSWLQKCISDSMAPFLNSLHRVNADRHFRNFRAFHKRAVQIAQSQQSLLTAEILLNIAITPLIMLFTIASVAGCTQAQHLICCESFSTMMSCQQDITKQPARLMQCVYEAIYSQLSQYLTRRENENSNYEPTADSKADQRTETDSFEHHPAISVSPSLQRQFTSHLAMKYLLVNLAPLVKQYQCQEWSLQLGAYVRRLDFSMTRIQRHGDESSMPPTEPSDDASALWSHIMQSAQINATLEALLSPHDRPQQATAPELQLSDRVELGWFSPQTKGFVVNRANPTEVALVLNERVHHFSTDRLPLCNIQNSGPDVEVQSSSFDTPSALRRTSGSIGQNLNMMFESVFGSEKSVPLLSKNTLDDDTADEFMKTELGSSASTSRQALIMKSETSERPSAWKQIVNKSQAVGRYHAKAEHETDDPCNLAEFKRVYHENATSFSETTATWIEPHPLYNCLLSGDQYGDIQLWEYGQDRPIFTFASKSKAAVKTIHFSDDGCRFGAVNSEHNLHLWNFQPSVVATSPYHFLSVNKLNDFSFLGSSSLLATCGLTQQRYPGHKPFFLLITDLTLHLDVQNGHSMNHEQSRAVVIVHKTLSNFHIR
eukprot:TRINITY_DN1585_c0_g1_i7.p1 TRINITY_DN1585_c0_g1~~TRINITY_DN1585_c0_g1_i7.p1  ORF type:complete len:1902 (+),score=296.34 TRINITY_DN1585_c0_g1_i7:71-5776(+)